MDIFLFDELITTFLGNEKNFLSIINALYGGKDVRKHGLEAFMKSSD